MLEDSKPSVVKVCELILAQCLAVLSDQTRYTSPGDTAKDTELLITAADKAWTLLQKINQGSSAV